MHYIGIDYSVDLACSSCKSTTRVRYSTLLKLVTNGKPVACEGCGRATNHDGTSASKARLLFRKHFYNTRPTVEAI